MILHRREAVKLSTPELEATMIPRLFIALMLLVLPAMASAQGGLAALTQQSTTFLPVDEAYRLQVDIEAPGQLRLNWQITDGYYLYRHAFDAELTDNNGVVETTLAIEPGLAKTDEYFGDVEVYYQSAQVGLSYSSTATRAQLSVTYQGCADAGLCYPPTKKVFTVDPATGQVSPGAPEPALTNAAITTSADAGTPPANTATDGVPAVSIGLAGAVLFAFLGGVILNAMPCVFPILSLKVLSFATGDPASHHRHSLVYLAGVVASFLAIAAVLISLQQTGQMVGWGFQLQSPGFIIALAYLFTAMGLSLSGVVQFGTSLMNMGSSLASEGGLRGSFFTGVLAVVVASPCTAPFMGSALGYALTQPPAVGLIVFAALGIGMAAPMVLLSFSPAARGLLPRPGPWMETLKELLAFPLYATAVWLLWVAGKQAGVDTMAAALGGLVLLALGLFLLRGGRLQQGLALLCLIAAIGMGGYRGDHREGSMAPGADGTEPWSPDRLAELRAAGTPVFVDVTADWCITCLANEQAVLFTDDMRSAFANAGVVYMVADWTNYDPQIGEFVRSHGRYGIPLYAMYPADPQASPVLLPQLLTRGIMLNALAAARASQPEASL